MEKKQLEVTARCPIRTTLEMLGGKWKLLILFQLKDGPHRLSELQQLIPDISEKMLIQELKSLVISDLVEKKQFKEVPPRVEYKLTDKGAKALPLIDQIAAFGIEYQKSLSEE